MSVEQIAKWADSADVVLVADGALNRIAHTTIPVDRVIGDLDSASHHFLENFSVHHDPSEDTSDCDKLIQFAIDEGHTELTLCSVEGDRLDHQLATLHSAAKAAISIRIAYRTGISHVLRGPGEWQLAANPDTIVSLIPISESTGVSLTGVKWPLNEMNLIPADSLSLSNRSLETTVNVSCKSGILIAMIETDGNPIWN